MSGDNRRRSVGGLLQNAGLPPFNAVGPTTRSRSQGCAAAGNAAVTHARDEQADQELQQEQPLNPEVPLVRNQRRRTRSHSRGDAGAASDHADANRQRNEERGHQLQQLAPADDRQEPHVAHQRDPEMPQVQNNRQQQVPQNAGRHETEAVDAGHQDVLPRNNNVPHAYQHLQQGENFNPEGQRRMAPLPADEQEPPVQYHPQQQPPLNIRYRAPPAVDAGHQQVWPRNNNVPHDYQHRAQGQNFNPQGHGRMAPPPVDEYPEYQENPYFYNYYEGYYNCQGQNNDQRWIAPQPVAASQCDEVWPPNNNYLRARDQYYGQGTSYSGKGQGPKKRGYDSRTGESRGQRHSDLVRENTEIKLKIAELEKQIDVFKKKEEDDERNRSMRQFLHEAIRIAQLRAQVPSIQLLPPTSTLSF